MAVPEDLAKHFGDYRAVDREKAWLRAKRSLPLGSLVSGQVKAQYPFGVFVDIGCDFPALLLVVRFVDAHVKRYDLSMYPSIGTTLSARVCAFDDIDHVIGVTQLERERMLGET